MASQHLTLTETLSALCKASGKWGMFISLGDTDFSDVFDAAPYLKNVHSYGQIRADGCAFALYDTEQELFADFDQTVGGDGPTGMNPYDGPGRVYALTCNPQGEIECENT